MDMRPVGLNQYKSTAVTEHYRLTHSSVGDRVGVPTICVDLSCCVPEPAQTCRGRRAQQSSQYILTKRGWKGSAFLFVAHGNNKEVRRNNSEIWGAQMETTSFDTCEADHPCSMYSGRTVRDSQFHLIYMWVSGNYGEWTGGRHVGTINCGRPGRVQRTAAALRRTMLGLQHLLSDAINLYLFYLTFTLHLRRMCCSPSPLSHILHILRSLALP
ncbi:hypothetical protein J6590_037743 [Homalodisca vitripennis]|nr:hypothetical protein J6590_037743 [Homalodisca vitripennis]